MLENKNASAINASVVLKRTLVIVSILLTIAFIHVLDVEAWLPRDWRGLYSSYFSDLALPFGFYFLLCANQVQRPFLRPWTVKAAIVFAMASLAESLQYFGLYTLGVIFDPMDYLVDAIGVMLAALLDARIFSRTFKFWTVGWIP